ncbi:myb-like protein x [Anaeramoeba flamelloides]|uniref:Myb-like protein x n=1 Tax=Anaeramoeba flamelloides TaxID=1746091 RepID=A0AAV7ZXR6_9EUKA|nr:myb-like protein x [Anaeramoeba flamelloides]
MSLEYVHFKTDGTFPIFQPLSLLTKLQTLRSPLVTLDIKPKLQKKLHSLILYELQNKSMTFSVSLFETGKDKTNYWIPCIFLLHGEGFSLKDFNEVLILSARFKETQKLLININDEHLFILSLDNIRYFILRSPDSLSRDRICNIFLILNNRSQANSNNQTKPKSTTKANDQEKKKEKQQKEEKEQEKEKKLENKSKGIRLLKYFPLIAPSISTKLAVDRLVLLPKYSVHNYEIQKPFHNKKSKKQQKHSSSDYFLKNKLFNQVEQSSSIKPKISTIYSAFTQPVTHQAILLNSILVHDSQIKIELFFDHFQINVPFSGSQITLYRKYNPFSKGLLINYFSPLKNNFDNQRSVLQFVIDENTFLYLEFFSEKQLLNFLQDFEIRKKVYLKNDCQDKQRLKKGQHSGFGELEKFKIIKKKVDKKKNKSESSKDQQKPKSREFTNIFNGKIMVHRSHNLPKFKGGVYESKLILNNNTFIIATEEIGSLKFFIAADQHLQILKGKTSIKVWINKAQFLYLLFDSIKLARNFYHKFKQIQQKIKHDFHLSYNKITNNNNKHKFIKYKHYATLSANKRSSKIKVQIQFSFDRIKVKAVFNNKQNFKQIIKLKNIIHISKLNSKLKCLIELRKHKKYEFTFLNRGERNYFYRLAGKRVHNVYYDVSFYNKCGKFEARGALSLQNNNYLIIEIGNKLPIHADQLSTQFANHKSYSHLLKLEIHKYKQSLILRFNREIEFKKFLDKFNGPITAMPQLLLDTTFDFKINLQFPQRFNVLLLARHFEVLRSATMIIQENSILMKLNEQTVYICKFVENFRISIDINCLNIVHFKTKQYYKIILFDSFQNLLKFLNLIYLKTLPETKPLNMNFQISGFKQSKLSEKIFLINNNITKKNRKSTINYNKLLNQEVPTLSFDCFILFDSELQLSTNESQLINFNFKKKNFLNQYLLLIHSPNEILISLLVDVNSTAFYLHPTNPLVFKFQIDNREIVFQLFNHSKKLRLLSLFSSLKNPPWYDSKINKIQLKSPVIEFFKVSKKKMLNNHLENKKKKISNKMLLDQDFSDSSSDLSSDVYSDFDSSSSQPESESGSESESDSSE